jgi:hypothetical protein
VSSINSSLHCGNASGSNFNLASGAVRISNAGALVSNNFIVGSGTLTMLGQRRVSRSILTNNAGGTLANARLIGRSTALQIATIVGGAGSFLASRRRIGAVR